MANPVSPAQLLLGKLAATTAFSVMTLLLSLLAFTVAARLMPVERLGMSLEIGPRFIAGTFIAMVPLAGVFSALQTLVGSYAKSYREAQAYLSMIMLIPIVPTMILNILPIKARLWMYTVPLMGQQVAITKLLRGESVPLIAFGISFVCTGVLAILLYLVTARLYRSERLTIST